MFVASMMACLNVHNKGQLVWNDIVEFRATLQKLDVLAQSKGKPNDSLNSHIVKLSDFYTNCKNGKLLLEKCLQDLPPSEKKQDAGLKEAFEAIVDLLCALHELDVPSWNQLKERVCVSLIKKTRTINTSLTSGIARSRLAEGDSIGFLNCGSGPIKFQFYKMDQNGVVHSMVDFTPPEEQNLSDS